MVVGNNARYTIIHTLKGEQKHEQIQMLLNGIQ